MPGPGSAGPSSAGPTAAGAGPSIGPAPSGPASGGGATPSPEQARSGINWDSWTLDEALSTARTALEVSRFVPGWGLLGGAAADLMGAYQDVTAIPPGEYPITNTLVVIRSGINIVNNGLGHLMYVGELIQNGLAGSVVFAEFVPVSAAAIETAAAVKVALDGALFYTDLGVEIGALWNQSKAGPEQWSAWQGVIDGYQANLVGDVAGIVLDTITLASAGAANVDTIKAGTGIFSTGAILAQRWGSTLITFVQNMFNVWGGSLPGIQGEQVPIGPRPPAAAAPTQGQAGAGGAPAPVQGMFDGGAGLDVQALFEGSGDAAQAGALRAASMILRMEADRGRMAWRLVDTGIGMLQEEAQRRMEELNVVVRQLSGGRDLFQVIRDGTTGALGHMREKLETLESLQQSATDADANATEVRESVDSVIAAIQGLQVPNVTIPDVELGDGMLADAGEWVLNSGAAAANAILRSVITQVQQAVDGVKDELVSPLEAIREQAGEIGEFLALVARVSGEQTTAIRQYIQNFEEGLAEADGFEGAVDVIIRQVTELLGLPSFRVQDIRDFWQSLPGYFDQVDTLADRLTARAAQLEQAGAGVQRQVAAPPPDPEDEEDTAAATGG